MLTQRPKFHMHFKWFILTFLVCSVRINAEAQTQIDSLYSIWHNEKQPDSVRTNAYSKYIRNAFLYSKPDSAYILAERLVNYGKDQNYPKAQSEGYTIQGIIYRNKSDYDKALDSYNKSLKIQENFNDEKGRAVTLHGIAIIYRRKGNFRKALDYYNQSITINKRLNNQQGIANSMTGIGVIYSLQGNYPKALDYFFNSLKTNQRVGNQNGISASLNNIGIVYHDQGDYDNALDYYNQALTIQIELDNQYGIANSYNNIGAILEIKGDDISALDYYTQSKAIYEVLGDKIGVADEFNNIGSIYEDKNEFDIALNFYKKGLKIHREVDYYDGIARSLINIGSVHLIQGNYDQSIANCQEGYRLAVAANDLQNQIEACQCLYDSYKANRKANEALYYMEKIRVLDDSVDVKETVKMLQKIEFRKEMLADSLEYSKKEALSKLQLENSETTKRFWVIGSVLLMLLASCIFYAYYQKKKANTYLVERNEFEIENKKKAMTLFSQQVSPEVAKELLSDSYKSGTNKLRACIMFLDIRDFTPFSESRDAAEINQYQNDVFGFMIDIITEYNGIINQFMGDGFLASFGAPASPGNHSQNAVNASLKILEELETRCTSGQLIDTKIGIGLHTGEIVTGNVGTAHRKQYSLTGNTVILASRIEQLNKEFKSELLISKDVMNDLDDLNNYNFKSLGYVQLKGTSEPVEIIKVL